jgi:hypothetical protein
MPSVQQLDQRMAANIAGASGYQNAHQLGARQMTIPRLISLSILRYA